MSRGSATSAVRLKRLTKKYGAVTAVAGIDLTLEPGEFLTLLGPSGSGKTSVLAMIAGFVEPSAGEIYVGDTLVNALPPYKRDIGMMFQSYALFPHMSVLDNVSFPLRVRHMQAADIRQRVAAALDMVSLSGLEKRKPHELSGGQQQRVSLARALVYRPKVLLLDEPLAALDKRLRDQMQLEIRRIHKESGTTTICVTHDQQEALVMSDRIAVMDNGQIRQIGSGRDIYNHPASQFVAQFIGDSNIFAGTIVEVAGKQGVARVTEHASVPVRFVNGFRPSPGERMQFGVRPSRLSLLSGDASGEPLGPRGVIAEKVFVGDSIVYRILVDDAWSLTANVPCRSRGEEFPLGSSVRVSWDPDDLVALGPTKEEQS